MAKSKIATISINEAVKKINSGNLLPVYFFFGEDSFSIDNALESLEKAVQPFVESDFDKETFYGEDRSAAEILNFASSFPFGTGKKFITVKEFEKIKDKKELVSYVKSPPDFTIIVFIHHGAISNIDTEPYRSLSANNLLFEAKELKGNTLVNWIIEYVKTNGKSISAENAQILIDISGENRNLLEAQLEKIFTFLGEEKEITLDSVQSLSTSLKEFSIFDLQNSLAVKDKANSLKIALSLLEKGAEPTFIVHMLTRYFTGLSRITELKEKNIPDQAAARIVGTHPFYYKDHVKARKIYNDHDIYRAVKALLKADLTIKTTGTDKKTLVTILIAEILSA